eukprot:CAMPEP_0182864260 /NCGR_PEP_ID=MMETSP0034_2-20130328/7077_1 /TAXON_ID=156128 /ORGANISM="Nephroselmis pyriformis, Strain CCMP717" /LENGTH=273 /DNA_ID=CAMNT_0024996513 /DNA_START=22 /DNA_END=843 /DNA_ORIENTATION=-
MAARFQGLTISAKPSAQAAKAPIASFAGFRQVQGKGVALNMAPRAVRLSASRVVTKAGSHVAEPAKLSVKDTKGGDAGSETLALKVAGDTARSLVHRYLVLVRQNARSGNASTLTRSEVRGGGKKPYQQKGTGNARRGSQRTPLRPGGGVTFGPKPRDWSIKMNKKERRLAMATAIQSAAADMVVVEDLSGKIDGKTKTMVAALKAWGAGEKDHCLLITKDEIAEVKRAGGNIEKLKMNNCHGLSVYDVLRADKIMIEKSALAYLNDFYGATA